MEKTFYDFSGKNIAAVKKEVRSALLADFMEFLSRKYEKVVPVSNTELAVLMGVWTDADGYSHDVVKQKQVVPPFMIPLEKKVEKQFNMTLIVRQILISLSKNRKQLKSKRMQKNMERKLPKTKVKVK